MRMGYGSPNDSRLTVVQPIKIDPVPRDQWPLWANLLAAKRTPADAGVGDTAVRIIGPTASDKFKKWFKHVFGRDCSCEKRQAQWNSQYPYDNQL